MIPLLSDQVLNFPELPAPVRVRRSPRARRVSLKIDAAAGEAILVLPKRASLVTGEAFARSQIGWLKSRLTALPGPVQLAAGSVVPLRGEPLEVVAVGGPSSVKIAEGKLLVGGSEAGLHARLLAFLKREARADLGAAVSRLAQALGKPARAISLRDPKSRWGSCAASGNLSFSWRLILAPPAVLHYVAAHEVAHLVQRNHAAVFWRQVKALDPQYEAALAWLRANGTALHRYR